MEISDEQIARFQDDGFLILESILTTTQVDSLLAAMDRLREGICTRDIRPPAQRTPPVMPVGEESTFLFYFNARVIDGEVWNIATDSNLGRAAALLLQTPSVSLIEDQLLTKRPHGNPLKLHQDFSAYGFSTSTNTLSCWIALADITEDLGPVECVRGSHRWGVTGSTVDLELDKDDAEGYLATAKQIIPPGINLDYVPALVPRGGGVFFHGLTLHGSRPNLTDRARPAATFHWAAADCRIDRKKLIGYGQPYLFNGLSQGDPLVNKYLPRVYSLQTNSQEAEFNRL